MQQGTYYYFTPQNRIKPPTQMLGAADMAGKMVCMEAGFTETFFDHNFPGVGIKKILKPSIFDCYPTLQNGQVGPAGNAMILLARSMHFHSFTCI